MKNKLRYKLVVNPRTIRKVHENDECSIHHVYLPGSELTRAIKHSGQTPPESVNPRSHGDYCLRGTIPTAIRDTLINSPEKFLLINRGLTILASDAAYDDKENSLTIDFGTVKEHSGKDALYGIVDGATTLAILLESSKIFDATKKSIAEDGPVANLDTALVHLEIITGISNRDIISNTAVGRNSSRAVKPFSIENFKGSYKFVIDAIKGQPYENKIGYEENADSEINILELTAVLNLFNPYWNTTSTQMPDSYTSKQSMVDRYRTMENNEDKAKRNEEFKLLAPIIPDLLKLYGTISTGFYQASRALDRRILSYGSRGKNGEIRSFVFRNWTKKPRPEIFTGLNRECDVPTGILFPLVAAHRALLVREIDGSIHWATDPFEFWETHKVALVDQILEQLGIYGDNPQTCGKKPSTYKHMYAQVRSLYNESKSESLSRENANLKEQLRRK